MFDPSSWTSQEAAFYVSSGLLVAFVILGAIGAYADEKGYKEVTTSSWALPEQWVSWRAWAT